MSSTWATTTARHHVGFAQVCSVLLRLPSCSPLCEIAKLAGWFLVMAVLVVVLVVMVVEVVVEVAMVAVTTAAGLAVAVLGGPTRFEMPPAVKTSKARGYETGTSA